MGDFQTQWEGIYWELKALADNIYFYLYRQV